MLQYSPIQLVYVAPVPVSLPVVIEKICKLSLLIGKVLIDLALHDFK